MLSTPGQCGLVGRVLSHAKKGFQFNFPSGHMPGLKT